MSRPAAQLVWINSRIRAMLLAFASCHPWLHWREPARLPARRFVDHEPGIHSPQAQMQAGTTAINSFGIANPLKQSRDREGALVRRWLRELASVPPADSFSEGP